ncbi:MAG: stage II sporulation protein M [Planctomycetota bacterium]|jgi:uncharacterized membrane protein SpoIIM required for sporulation
MEQVRLKSFEFRRERQATWTELERLVQRVEKRGVRSLSAGELARLPLLYRATLSSLSVARSISLDRNVLDYLESLAARAYFCVYGTKRSLRDVLADFFGRGFPAAIRRFRWHLAVSALFMLLGAITSFVLTARNPEWFYAFVPEGYAQDRNPAATTEALREALYHREDTAGMLTAFTSFLFTHNARIGMLAFALGFAAGLPVYLLLFYNGLILGAFGALYQGRGLGLDFWGWVLPHGVTELGAVIVCGGAGLVLAQSLVFPGRQTRLRNLARRGREAGILVLGAVAMFFVAALIEGFFRQLVQGVAPRYAVTLGTALAWACYFGWAGRREA